MTKKEALQDMLPVGLQDNLIEKALLDNNVNGADTYTSDNEKEIDLVYVELLNYVITQGRLIEGGLSIPRGRCINEKRRILKKYGMDTSGINSVITDGTDKW